MNGRIEEVTKNGIILFGIKPSNPETGYGYLKLEKCKTSLKKVLEFTEKPSLAIAKEYIKSGYLWNSGIFLCSVGHLAQIAHWRKI